MKALMRALITAALAAAVLLIVGEVAAECLPGDPDCPLPQPPETIRVNPDGGGADGQRLGYADPAVLQPLEMGIPSYGSLYVEPAALPSASEGNPIPPSFPVLDIPLRNQDPGDISCGAQALGMALEGVEGVAPSSSALLGYLQGNNMMYSFGTGVEELAQTAQFFGYRGSHAFHNWSLEDIFQELTEGYPVVVALGSIQGEPGHFVTLTGISPDGSWVSYNDPLSGSVVLPLEEFQRAWSLQGNSGVRVRKSAAQGGGDISPWVAFFAGVMALVSTSSIVTTRKGIGRGKESVTGELNPMRLPPGPAPPGYRWVPKERVIYETRLVQDGWKTIRKPHMVNVWRQVGWKDVLVPQYCTVTEHVGWEYYTVQVPYTVWESYIKYYKQELYWHNGELAVRKVPVYGSRQVTKYRSEQRKRPIWETREVFSHYVTEKEPVYGWVQEQDGWETDSVPNMVEREFEVGREIVWELEKLPEPPPEPKPAVTNGNLRIRKEPSVESAVLAYVIPGTPVSYLGVDEVIQDTTWANVEYIDPNKGQIIGWVNKKYLDIPEPPPQYELPKPRRTKEELLVWLNELWTMVFSDEERLRILQQQYERYSKLQSEVTGLLQSPLELFESGVLPEEDLLTYTEWKAHLEALLEFPDWLLAGEAPPILIGLVDEQVVEVIEALSTHPEYLTEQVPASAWTAMAEVIGLTGPDLLLSLLGVVSPLWSNYYTAGNYPVTLRIDELEGVLLRAEPSIESEVLGGGVFQGIPFGATVVWNGEYYVEEHPDGSTTTFFQVVFEWEGVAYTGWVAAQYTSPVYSPSGGNPDNGLLINTFGYGTGAEAWELYANGSAAQYLNLHLLFKTLGVDNYSDFPTAHYNLCGQLAVMAALGVSLEEGLLAFYNMGPEAQAILMDEGEGTSVGELIDFLSELGWDGESGSGSGLLGSILQAGGPAMALIAIDEEGNPSSNGYIGHWVQVTEYGLDEVWIYNPFTNENISIPRSDFDHAWSQATNTPNNSSADQLVVYANP